MEAVLRATERYPLAPAASMHLPCDSLRAMILRSVSAILAPSTHALESEFSWLPEMRSMPSPVVSPPSSMPAPPASSRQRASTRSKIANVYAGRNGIIGALTEDMIDTNRESASTIAALMYTPGGAFGSARYKLKGLEENRAEYERLIEVFKAHDIGYFFYNGGNDSMDTAHKVSQLSKKMGFPVTCLGIPKTVDNDLPITDNCPGFGSVAKYVAVSTQEAALDVLSMAKTSTKVFILEVMGRHAGWIAAAGGLAGKKPGCAAHHPVPEVPFDERRFLKVKRRMRGTLRVLRHRRQ